VSVLFGLTSVLKYSGGMSASSGMPNLCATSIKRLWRSASVSGGARSLGGLFGNLTHSYSVSQFLRFGLLERLSRFIGQPLAFDANDRAVGASHVMIAGFDPVRVTEIELGEIAMKMLLAAMLIDADHPTLEDRVISLNGIGIDLLAAHAVSVAVFAARMVDNA
jgi:hypothetical protein